MSTYLYQHTYLSLTTNQHIPTYVNQPTPTNLHQHTYPPISTHTYLSSYQHIPTHVNLPSFTYLPVPIPKYQYIIAADPGAGIGLVLSRNRELIFFGTKCFKW